MEATEHAVPLSEQKCDACEGGVAKLGQNQISNLLRTLDDAWIAVDNHHLRRPFRFTDFVEALAFTNRVGDLAEAEGHHPDIDLGWGKANITLWTHAVDGLTINDFILAAKISELAEAD